MNDGEELGAMILGWIISCGVLLFISIISKMMVCA